MTRFIRARTGNARDPSSQSLRGFNIDRIIQRNQRLEGRIASWPAEGAHFAVWRVERRHRRIRTRAPPLDIQRAAIPVLALAVLPIQRAAERRAQALRWPGRADGWTVHFM